MQKYIRELAGMKFSLYRHTEKSRMKNGETESTYKMKIMKTKYIPSETVTGQTQDMSQAVQKTLEK